MSHLETKKPYHKIRVSDWRETFNSIGGSYPLCLLSCLFILWHSISSHLIMLFLFFYILIFERRMICNLFYILSLFIYTLYFSCVFFDAYVHQFLIKINRDKNKTSSHYQPEIIESGYGAIDPGIYEDFRSKIPRCLHAMHIWNSWN